MLPRFYSFSCLLSEFQPCVPNKDGSQMVCIMPSIKSFMHNFDESDTISVSVFFEMDGITSLGSGDSGFKSKGKLSRYLYYKDPQPYKFEGDEDLMLFDIGDEFLTIKVWCSPVTLRT